MNTQNKMQKTKSIHMELLTEKKKIEKKETARKNPREN